MRSTSLFNKIFSDVWFTHLDIQRDGSHKLLPRHSPSVEIAEVTFFNLQWRLSKRGF